MKLCKKLFAIVLCLALVLGTVPMMMASADSIDAVPAPVEDKYIVDSFGDLTYSNSWGGAYGWTIDRMFIGLESPDVFDWSTADYIEFDMYIEDLVDFKAMVEKNPNLRFIIGSGGYGRDSRFTNYRSVIVLDNLITKSGWNHIKVPTSKFTSYPGQNGADRTASKFVTMNWHDRITEAVPSQTQGDYYKIANVCATVSGIDMVPATNENSLVDIYAGDKFTIPQKFAWCWDNTYREFSAVNAAAALAAGGRCEFDFFVPSAADFQASCANDPMRFVVHTQQRWSHRIAFNFIDQVTKDGWNHIVIDSAADYFTSESGVDYTQIVGFSFGFWGNSQSTNPEWNKQYRFANVCVASVPTDGGDDGEGSEAVVEKVLYSTGDENDRTKITYEPNGWTGPERTFKGTNLGWENNYRIVRRSAYGLADLSECTTLSFDLWIEDAEAYEAWREHIFFYVCQDNGTTATYPLPKGLVTGFNTITLDLGVIAKQGVDLSKTEVIGIYSLPNGNWWGTRPSGYDNTGIGYTDSSIADFKFAVKNVYGIKGTRANNADELYIDAGLHSFWGDRASNFDWCNLKYTLANPVDVTGYSYVEFDIYISDADALRAEVLSDGVTKRWSSTNVRFGKDEASAKNFGFGADKLQTGFNHIMIPVSQLGDNASALQFIRLYNERYNDSQVPSGIYSFGVYNIKATNTHKHVYNKTVIAATCTTAGYTNNVCGCGDSYQSDYVKALGHNYAEEVTAPTCQAEGYTTYTCATCGDTYKDNTTAVVDHNYVDGYCSFGCGTKEPAIVYTFGHTMQIKSSEPFGLFFNGIVYDNGAVVDYDTLSDYGMFIASSDDFDAMPTVEELVAAGKLYAKGNDKVAIGTSNEKAAICVTYDEAIYAYEMDKVYYSVFFAADKNGNVSYADVKERSVNGVVQDYQDNASDYAESLINLCDKMDAMFEVTTSYRDARPERYEFNNAEPETFADKTFGAAATGDYTFGHTMQLASCEPWALIFNAAVRVNGNVIDYSACDEYGLIVSDKAFTSIADVDASAYVYNNVNGGATVKGDYISVDYVEGIYSSEMGKDFYAMFYVVVDGQYYYGAVKTRSMLSVANQYFANAGNYQDDVIALLNAMVDLYDATIAYKAN